MESNPLKQFDEVKKHRVVREFTLPESLIGKDSIGPRKVALRQLSADEELMASKIGRFDIMRAQYAAAKLSIVELDGKPVHYADTVLEAFWERSDPRVRSLLLQAYNRLSSPTKEEEEDFFGSEVVKV